ncbi:MAG: aminotransferase class V-fold PLP-dependent enzyme [Alphaproteobacteria bacterium]
MTFSIPTSRAQALAYDAADPLAPLRAQFKIPGGMTYLVGHSLGPATHSALAAIRQTAETDWANDIVRGWNSADWINLAKTVGAKIAPLIGAKPHDVVICDSVSVNLFKLAASALPHAKTHEIMIEDDEFPTDQYIAKGLADLAAAKLTKLPAGAAMAALSGGGVLIKSAVNYRTAEIADMASFEDAARRSGALIVWDFSHATGIAPIDVAASGARLGAGCTYKYLNGGPGAPAFIYAREDIAKTLLSPLPGWLGHKTPFTFDADYAPADHAARFVAGTPPILSLSALSGALDVFRGLDMQRHAQKAQVMSSLALSRAAQMGLKTTSPPYPVKRGGHISLLHDNGYPIVQALAAQGIMADFRTPDTIRLGFNPLYISMTETWDVMDVLADILDTRAWDTSEFKMRAEVT